MWKENIIDVLFRLSFCPCFKIACVSFLKIMMIQVRSRAVEPFEKNFGGRSNLVGIVYPPDWDRFNGSAQIQGGDCPLVPRFLRPCVGVTIFGLCGFQLVQKMVVLSVTIKYTILISTVLERKAQERKIHFSNCLIVQLQLM